MTPSMSANVSWILWTHSTGNSLLNSELSSVTGSSSEATATPLCSFNQPSMEWPWKAPLIADLERRNSSVVGHAIDRGSVDVKNLLKLAGGQELSHDIIQCC